MSSESARMEKGIVEIELQTEELSNFLTTNSGIDLSKIDYPFSIIKNYLICFEIRNVPYIS